VNRYRSIPFRYIVKFAVWRCYYRKASIMGALRFVGLAILTAVAPIAVLIGSSPAHADPPTEGHGGLIWTFAEDDNYLGGPCTCRGLSIFSGTSVLLCDSDWHWSRGQREKGPPDVGQRPDGSGCTEP
jgi:hypothetical protein